MCEPGLSHTAGDGFLPIQGWPGYFVNRLGQVRSEFGPLNFDAQGRVGLREAGSKKYRKLPIGRIMDAAGLLAAPNGPEPALVEAELDALRQERDAARSDLAALSGRIQEAQRVNQHNRSLNAALWVRLRSLETELAQQPDRGRKKARIAAERFAWEAGGLGILEEFGL